MFISSLLKNERKSYLFSETQYSKLFTVLYIIVDKIIKYLTISHNLFTMNFSMFKIRIFDGDLVLSQYKEFVGVIDENGPKVCQI